MSGQLHYYKYCISLLPFYIPFHKKRKVFTPRAGKHSFGENNLYTPSLFFILIFQLQMRVCTHICT